MHFCIKILRFHLANLAHVEYNKASNIIIEMPISEPTAVFSIRDDRDMEIKQAVLQVYRALEEKGYNPINQLVGYILSEDPTYITTYKNARAIIRRIDRDDLLQALVRDFVKH